MDIKELLARNAENTDALIGKYLENGEASTETLYKAMRYSALAPGKRIRPFLTFGFCKMFGGDTKKAEAFAVAIELVHASSLVHDDMPCMDNDGLRRGRPTNHVVFGEGTALLCGDSLITKGYEAAAGNRLVSPEASRAATEMLLINAGAYGMMGGQMIDLESENKEISFETLLKMHDKKTGALIRAACLLGCYACEITSPDDGRYADTVAYANGIGLTFQIIDDILDITSDEKTLGKAVHADAKEHKNTFISFMSVGEAYKYAERETEKAVNAIKIRKQRSIVRSCAFSARKKK